MSQPPPTMTEQWIQVGSGEIRVRRRRPDGAAVPVVFVHGAFVNGHLWDGVVHALDAAPTPLDLVVPDLPLGAHHRPMAPDSAITLPAVGDMVIATLDALGLDRVVVAANDSGGAITQHLLGAHPDRFTAALLTPTETPDNFPPSFFRYLFPVLRVRSLMWLAAQSLRSNLGRRSPITFGFLIHRPLDRDEATRLMGPLWSSPGARSDLRRLLVGLDPSTMGHVLEAASRFAGPVDVAWSAGDRIFPESDADLLAATYPAGRRVPDITDAGSISPLDRPDAVADRLLALVDRLVSTDAGTDAAVLV